jgi:Ca2+-binding EF-hand superfamily protein
MIKRVKSPKKSETLEVRLSHAVKKAFMARARVRGKTASELLREFIESYLQETDPWKEKRKMLRKLTMRGTMASLATVVTLQLVLPVAASATPDLQALFERLDTDQNDQLSEEEFSARGSGGYHSAVQGLHLGDVIPMVIAIHFGVEMSESDMKREDLREAFMSHDHNSDGNVTFGEFESQQIDELRWVFDTIDADSTGAIEEIEFDRMLDQLPSSFAQNAKTFGEIDNDGSGAVSWKEFLS